MKNKFFLMLSLSFFINGAVFPMEEENHQPNRGRLGVPDLMRMSKEELLEYQEKMELIAKIHKLGSDIKLKDYEVFQKQHIVAREKEKGDIEISNMKEEHELNKKYADQERKAKLIGQQADIIAKFDKISAETRGIELDNKKKELNLFGEKRKAEASVFGLIGDFFGGTTAPVEIGSIGYESKSHEMRQSLLTRTNKLIEDSPDKLGENSPNNNSNAKKTNVTVEEPE